LGCIAQWKFSSTFFREFVLLDLQEAALQAVLAVSLSGSSQVLGARFLLSRQGKFNPLENLISPSALLRLKDGESLLWESP
jgi:hypothetical protein